MSFVAADYKLCLMFKITAKHLGYEQVLKCQSYQCKKKKKRKKHFYCIEIYSNKNRVGVLEGI